MHRKHMHQMSVSMSAEINGVLAQFAREHGVTKAEALRRAINLLALAQEQKAKKRFLAVMEEGENNEQGQQVGRISGI